MASVIESLELRRLFSDSLVEGVLLIEGTAGNDLVSFAPAPGFLEGGPVITPDSSFSVKVNNEMQTFQANDIERVEMHLGGGDDSFSYECVVIIGFDSSDFPSLFDVTNPPEVFFDLPISIDGGSGDDSLHAGNGNDSIDGGAGDDLIFGGQGNDSLFGEGGNDRITGREGNDFIDGGRGRDHLFGGAGDDTFTNDSQFLHLRGGDGEDVYGVPARLNSMPLRVGKLIELDVERVDRALAAGCCGSVSLGLVGVTLPPPLFWNDPVFERFAFQV